MNDLHQLLEPKARELRKKAAALVSATPHFKKLQARLERLHKEERALDTELKAAHLWATHEGKLQASTDHPDVRKAQQLVDAVTIEITNLDIRMRLEKKLARALSPDTTKAIVALIKRIEAL